MSLAQVLYNTEAQMAIEDDSAITQAMKSGVFKPAVLMHIYVTLLSPSHIFVLLAYSPVFIIVVMLEVKMSGETENEAYAKNVAKKVPVVFFFSFMVYYIL